MDKSDDLRFIDYDSKYRSECLKLFDSNCPEYFAINERDDYDLYLTKNPVGYELLELNECIVGAFGLYKTTAGTGEIHWILLDPKVHGIGLGAMMMDRVANTAQRESLKQIKIAASHLSAPFFEKFGAKEINKKEHGWGIGMHRHDMLLEL